MIKTKREINNIWNTNPFAIAWRDKLSIIKKKENDKKIFLKTPQNDKIYKEWKEQRDIYLSELRKLNNITEKLKD